MRIGTTNFAENEILGELYKQALEAKGISVELQASIGPREQMILALRGGLIDMYPEYVGGLLSEIHKIVDRPESPQAAYELAKKLERPKGFTLLAQTKLSNDNALAVLKSVGARRRIDSIDDLKRLRRGERVGVSPEFLTRFEGLIGLRELYGLTPRTKIVDVPNGEQYPELDKAPGHRRVRLHDRQPARVGALHAAEGSEGRLRDEPRRAADQPQDPRRERARSWPRRSTP